MTDAVCVLDARAGLGEGPVWCPEEQALYWVDIDKPALHRFAPATGVARSWAMPEAIGCVGLRRGGGAIAGLRSGFAFIDLEIGAVERVYAPEPDKPKNRLNDGRCDRAGRFWAGSMVEDSDRLEAALYRFDPDRRCRKMAGGIGCSNGLAWSPDTRVMYHADSRQGTVFAYDFDIDTGEIRNRRVFAVAPPGAGSPDGAAVDEEGCYWSARYGGWRIVRHAPDGREIGTLMMPVAKPTMCAFGGEALDVLYVTSAAHKLAPAELAKQPLAGGLFALEVGVRGLPEPRFGG
ncbi:MAG: SMP-30/gluconolactonase/LRE family protein [Pseudomonadota bacterium]